MTNYLRQLFWNTYSNITINVQQNKNKYLILNNNNILIVTYIVKSLVKAIYLIVKKFNYHSDYDLILNNINFSEIGVFIVNTSHIYEEFCIQLSDIKFKCFFLLGCQIY